jgi:hypothetical protein
MDPQTLRDAVMQWLENEGASLNTLAGAVAVLDKLIQKAPLTEEDVFTDGGQIIGGRGFKLRQALQKYGISPGFLSDGVTTRSTNKFRGLLRALDNGIALASLTTDERQEAVSILIAPLATLISEKIHRSPLTIDFSSHRSLAAQIQDVLLRTRDRSRGRVEQHLVGAKLESRFPNLPINRLRAYAADVQTERTGDFVVRQTVYHVTASPAPLLIEKTKRNLIDKLQPVLLVPRDLLHRARQLAIEGNVLDQIMIFSIEEFLTQNILEMADDKAIEHDDMFRQVLGLYNRRIEEVESDSVSTYHVRGLELIN